MYYRTQSTAIFSQGDSQWILQPSPGINILHGKDAEAFVISLAGPWCNNRAHRETPFPFVIHTNILWDDNISFWVRYAEDALSVRQAQASVSNPAKLTRDFFMQARRDFRNNQCLCNTITQLQDALKNTADRYPIFCYRILEQLDAPEQAALLQRLAASNRQVLIALTDDHKPVLPDGVTIHPISLYNSGSQLS